MIATIYSQPGCMACDRVAAFFLRIGYLVQMRQTDPKELAKFPTVRTAIMAQLMDQDETPVIDVNGSIIPLDELKKVLMKWEAEDCPFGVAEDWPLQGVHFKKESSC